MVTCSKTGILIERASSSIEYQKISPTLHVGVLVDLIQAANTGAGGWENLFKPNVSNEFQHLFLFDEIRHSSAVRHMRVRRARSLEGRLIGPTLPPPHSRTKLFAFSFATTRFTALDSFFS